MARFHEKQYTPLLGGIVHRQKKQIVSVGSILMWRTQGVARWHKDCAVFVDPASHAKLPFSMKSRQHFKHTDSHGLDSSLIQEAFTVQARLTRCWRCC